MGAEESVTEVKPDNDAAVPPKLTEVPPIVTELLANFAFVTLLSSMVPVSYTHLTLPTSDLV